MSNVVIDIAAEFTGKKAFKQADSAAAKLNKNIKKLAGTFGIAFGAQALVQFGKSTVKAFAEDEAAALRLNRAVENLGIGFANPAIADYISKLEKSAAVSDDILRPAFQGLLTTTGSLVQSQKLLSDAITISRASGIDLATVTEDLGRGYIGITKGLTKYNTGLSKAELQSKSFNEILGIMLARSAGAAEDYLSTTSYKMDVLSVATSNASEIIGNGFVDALAAASGGTEASDAQIFLETMAGLFNKITLAAGTTIGAIPSLIRNIKNLPKNIFSGFVGSQLQVNTSTPPKKAETATTLSEKKRKELLAQFEKDALRREKERLALKNKQVAADKLALTIAKAQAALGQGENVFDLEAIQLNAAQINQAQLLGKATTAAQLAAIANDVQRLNVKQAMYNLEQAIASKDQAAIVAATERLNKELSLYGALTGQEVKLKDIKTVLESLTAKKLIDIDNLDEAMKKLEALGTTIANPFAAVTDGALAAANALNGLSGSFNSTSAATVDLTNKVAQMSFQQGIAAGNSLAESISGARYAAQAAAMMENPFENFSSSLTFAANAAKHLIEQVQLTGSVAQASFQQGIAAANSLAASISGARYAAQAAAAAGMGYVSTNADLSALTDTTAADTTATNNATGDVNITVNTGIGDPNAIAEAIEEVLNNAINRGTLVGGVFAI